MRGINTLVLSAILTLGGWLPLTAGHAAPPVSASISTPATETIPEPAPAADYRLFAVGAGAIVGVVAFNMLTYPLGSVPFVAGALAGTPVDIALGSRLLAGIASGASALVAHYLYIFSTEDTPATR